MAEDDGTLVETKRDDGEPLFVPDYLLYLLAAASEAASAQFHAHVRENGLRVPEWRVLACLTDWDGAMVTELARYAMIEQSRLTKIIIQMGERGLVTRKNDPADGRRVRVYLTEEGRTLAQRLVADARVHERKVMKSLKNGSALAIKDTLKSLLSSLGEDARFDAARGSGGRNGADRDDNI